MIATKKLTALVAAMLSLFMLMTLCAIPAYADESGAESDTQIESVAETAPAESGKETGAESGKETTTETGKETTAETGKETSASTESETAATTPVDNTDTVRWLINLAIGAVILLILAILAIKFRAKIPGWWSSLKSECKKISWCSKDKLKKNTFVVIIIILIVTAAIAILDFAFSRGVDILLSIF